jgi:hypothetical protein
MPRAASSSTRNCCLRPTLSVRDNCMIGRHMLPASRGLSLICSSKRSGSRSMLTKDDTPEESTRSGCKPPSTKPSAFPGNALVPNCNGRFAVRKQRPKSWWPYCRAKRPPPHLRGGLSKPRAQASCGDAGRYRPSATARIVPRHSPPRPGDSCAASLFPPSRLIGRFNLLVR